MLDPQIGQQSRLLSRHQGRLWVEWLQGGHLWRRSKLSSKLLSWSYAKMESEVGTGQCKLWLRWGCERPQVQAPEHGWMRKSHLIVDAQRWCDLPVLMPVDTIYYYYTLVAPNMITGTGSCTFYVETQISVITQVQASLLLNARIQCWFNTKHDPMSMKTLTMESCQELLLLSTCRFYEWKEGVFRTGWELCLQCCQRDCGAATEGCGRNVRSCNTNFCVPGAQSIGVCVLVMYR